MNKLKKGYCIGSVVFAVFVMVLTFFVYSPQQVNAAGMTAGTIAGSQTANGTGSQNQTTDSRNDINNGFSISYNNDSGTLSGPLKILLVLTVISLAPSLLIMLTSFTRIIIVLHFVRTAIGTQTVPPNQVLIGLALFLTIFIMSPIFSEINEKAIQPLDRGEITQEEALEAGMEPLREFMFSQTMRKDIDLLCDIQGITYETQDDVTTGTLIPAFILSELRTAFIIGFIIYIPFIVIDMVVSSVLMSMGMMMLPPTTISMPFKILLFILADGWDLVVGSLVKTFY